MRLARVLQVHRYTQGPDTDTSADATVFEYEMQIIKNVRLLRPFVNLKLFGKILYIIRNNLKIISLVKRSISNDPIIIQN